MINKELQLNPKLFKNDLEQKATRDGFGAGVVVAGADNRNVVVLSADLTDSTKCGEFAKQFPERFFQVGVAEQNLATISAGMGISGKIPYISSYATFSPGRNWEQIRTTISYNNSNVKIAGHHAGISVGPDGATHQAVEDIATMRVMANMMVIVPCDMIQAKKATIAAAKIWGPVYLRYAREKSPVVTTESTPFVPGKAQVMWESRRPRVALIACGVLVYNALLSASELAKEGIESVVVNCHTIKPLDEEKLIPLIKKAGAVVTIEEHQITGGLGGAIAELSAKHCPVPMEFIGMQNVFGESGPASALIEKYGMGVKAIVSSAKRAVRRNK
jgi:transketolase